MRRDERGAKGERIGEHVPGVREQRERPGDQAGGDLARHEAEDQAERDRERATVAHARVVVRVAHRRGGGGRSGGGGGGEGEGEAGGGGERGRRVARAGPAP